MLESQQQAQNNNVFEGLLRPALTPHIYLNSRRWELQDRLNRVIDEGGDEDEINSLIERIQGVNEAILNLEQQPEVEPQEPENPQLNAVGDVYLHMLRLLMRQQVPQNNRAQLGLLFLGLLGQNMIPNFEILAEDTNTLADRWREFLQSTHPIPLERKYLDKIPAMRYECQCRSTQCYVCLEDFDKDNEDEMIRNLPCEHAFHTKCIDKWFENAPTCPVCKRDMRDVLDNKTNEN